MGRRREAGLVRANQVDIMAEEPGQLDGEGSPKMGIAGPRTVCDGHCLRDELGVPRHL